MRLSNTPSDFVERSRTHAARVVGRLAGARTGMRSLATALTIISALAAVACDRPREVAPEARLGSITAIRMTKTACNGTCPEYTVRFTPDGRATYDGGRYAPRQGRFTALADFDALADWVATQHPETLRDRYAGGAIDTQIVTLAVEWNKRRRIITTSRETAVPLRFEGLLLAIDGFTARLRWRRDDAASPFLGTFASDASAVEIGDRRDQSGFWAFGPSLRCGMASAQLTFAGGVMRVHCGPRTGELRATSAGLVASGDALPPGLYRRVALRSASALLGYHPEPRETE